jgi:hypothetical protein
MLPFSLYFVTALVTGFHLYALLSVVVYGVPLNPLELVSWLGSLGLLVAAYVSLFRPRAAARVALIACLAMWCFYAPALANLVRAKLDKSSAVSQGMGPRRGAARDTPRPPIESACL